MASSSTQRTAASTLGLAALAALVLAAAPASAQTTTINFDNFTAQAALGLYVVGNTYSIQGFTFDSNGSGFLALAGNGFFGDGETSLYSNRVGSTTLTQDNGQAFNLNAIDLGPIHGNSTPPISNDGPTLFTGTRADGTIVTATKITNDPNAYFQTFGFTGFTNLTSLTFTPQGNSVPQFDNVVLTPAAVPEASTSLGFGSLLTLGAVGGLVLRARKRKVVQGAKP